MEACGGGVVVCGVCVCVCVHRGQRLGRLMLCLVRIRRNSNITRGVSSTERQQRGGGGRGGRGEREGETHRHQQIERDGQTDRGTTEETETKKE